MKSFRSRIVVWTSLISGLVMLGFGVASNVAFERLKLQTVDDLLLSIVSRPAPPPRHDRFWSRSGEAAAREAERRLGTQSLLAVYAGNAPAATPSSDGRALVIGEWEAVFAGAAPLPAARGELGATDPREGQLAADGRGAARFGRGLGRIWRESALRPVEFVEYRSPITGSNWRFAVAYFPGYNVALGVDLEPVMRDVEQARHAFLIAFPVALGVLGLSIWFFATRAIAPLRRLTHTAVRVSAKSLNARLDPKGEDREFVELINVFNAMLDRLEKSFSQATRFSADAAHELKTPLTILQGQLEVALQEAPDGSDQQRFLANLSEETHRLKSITRKLLLLAQADAGKLPVRAETVDLSALVGECVESLTETTPEADFRIEADAPVCADCDPSLTRQILLNLLQNASSYNQPPNGRIDLSLSKQDGCAVVEIENGCWPISPQERARLFERFARGDESRTRSTDGTGLGLSLALEFAWAQGGSLTLVKETADERIRFRLSLPAADDPTG